MPQLYYGFKNKNKPYINTLKKWSSINTLNKDFYVALSIYKSGKIDKYALTGENEWIENTDIIKIHQTPQDFISIDTNTYLISIAITP